MKHISEIINEERNKFPFLLDEPETDEDDEENDDEFEDDYDFGEDDDDNENLD